MAEEVATGEVLVAGSFTRLQEVVEKASAAGLFTIVGKISTGGRLVLIRPFVTVVDLTTLPWLDGEPLEGPVMGREGGSKWIVTISQVNLNYSRETEGEAGERILEGLELRTLISYPSGAEGEAGLAPREEALEIVAGEVKANGYLSQEAITALVREVTAQIVNLSLYEAFRVFMEHSLAITPEVKEFLELPECKVYIEALRLFSVSETPQ